ncbi:sensor histidine kinase [Flammeovirga kamogawensis]|uniref:Histidine kinase n=1 Tax=Flammeovirga kamogawensis TaxID=373891 RepID=A0ABX8GPV3_9BACT|nr:histidine kinase [Flammeovirga kamogawensis]MBB6463478.1 LytS/YehU family sensor histidine kinase [Flammeovirga kamogawensis]QWG05596.1 histidine kinase [Flammeovirga kamogawensis]TRX67428.1 GHKL domain-containing protein [Flammeovirga kamogawensis]
MQSNKVYTYVILTYLISFFIYYFWQDLAGYTEFQWLGLEHLIILNTVITLIKCGGSLLVIKGAKKALRKSLLLALLILVTGYIMVMVASYYILWEFKLSYYYEFYSTFSFFRFSSFQELIFPFIAMLIIEVTFDYFRQYKEQQSLKIEKTKAELNFLKGQISPHFLFNTINTIFWLIVKKPKEAQALLLNLSDMLRYQLYDCENNFVPLQKEVDYLNDLISIEKHRKGSDVTVTTSFELENEQFQVPPLLFLPLVENAFKHVSKKADSYNFIKIELIQNANKVSFHVENSTDNSVVKTIEDKKYSGIGLKNIQKRMTLILKENYVFETTQIDNTYHAKIEF